MIKKFKIFEDLDNIYNDMIENTYWVYKSFKNIDITMKILNSNYNGKKYEIFNPESGQIVTNLYYTHKEFTEYYIDFRKATQKEIKEFELNKQTNKYNL